MLAPAAPQSLWCEWPGYAANNAWGRAFPDGDLDDFWVELDAFDLPDGDPLPAPPDDVLPDRAAVRASLPRPAALYAG